MDFVGFAGQQALGEGVADEAVDAEDQDALLALHGAPCGQGASQSRNRWPARGELAASWATVAVRRRLRAARVDSQIAVPAGDDQRVESRPPCPGVSSANAARADCGLPHQDTSVVPAWVNAPGYGRVTARTRLRTCGAAAMPVDLAVRGACARRSRWPGL